MARRDVEEDMRSRYTDYSCVTPLEQFTNELEQLLKRWRVKEAIDLNSASKTALHFDHQEHESSSLTSPEGVWEVAELACPLLGLPGVRVEFLALPPSQCTSTTEDEEAAAATAEWQLDEASDVRALGNRWACDRCGADAPGLAEWFAVRRCVSLFLPRSTSVLAGWGNEPTSTDRARCKSALGALIVACGNIGRLGGLPLFAAVVVPSSTSSSAATSTTTAASGAPTSAGAATIVSSATAAPQRHRFGACDVLVGYMLPTDTGRPSRKPLVVDQEDGSSANDGQVYVFEAEQRNQPTAAMRRLNGLLELFNAHADRVLGSGCSSGSSGSSSSGGRASNSSGSRRNSHGHNQSPSSTATASNNNTGTATTRSTVTRCAVRFSWRWEQSLWHAWVGADASGGSVAWRAWPYRNAKDAPWVVGILQATRKTTKEAPGGGGGSVDSDVTLMTKMMAKRRWRGVRRMQARLKCLPQASSLQNSSYNGKSNNNATATRHPSHSNGSDHASGVPGQRWTMLGDAKDPLKALEVTACWPGFAAGGSWMETPSHTTLRPRDCPVVRVQAIWASHHDGYSSGNDEDKINNSSHGGGRSSSGGSDNGTNLKLSPSADSLDTNDSHASARSIAGSSDGNGDGYGGSERSFGGESEDSSYGDNSKCPTRLPQPLHGKSSLRAEGARALRHAPPLAAKIWALLGAWCHAIALEESATPQGAQASSSTSSVVVMADLCRFPDLAHAYEELSSNNSGSGSGVEEGDFESRGAAESPNGKSRDGRLHGFEAADALASVLSIQARASVRAYRRVGDTSPRASSEMAAAVEWLLRPDVDGNRNQDGDDDGDSDSATANASNPADDSGKTGTSTKIEAKNGASINDDDDALLAEWANRPLWLWSGNGSAPVGRLASCLALWLSSLNSNNNNTSRSSNSRGGGSGNGASSGSSSGSSSALSGGLGGSGGIASGWAEFCAALRAHWESRRPIPHLGADLNGADLGLAGLSGSIKDGNDSSDKGQGQDQSEDKDDESGEYPRPRHLAVPLPPGATAPDRCLGLLSQKLQFLDACIRCAIEDEKHDNESHRKINGSSTSHGVAPISIQKPSAADLARASSSPSSASQHSWDWSGGGPLDDPLVGARVELHGLLATPALNGVRGKVVGWSEEAGRYEVETETAVDFQALFMVKKRNLKIVESSTSRSPSRVTTTATATPTAAPTVDNVADTDTTEANLGSSPVIMLSPPSSPLPDTLRDTLNTPPKHNADTGSNIKSTIANDDSILAEDEVWADPDGAGGDANNDTSSAIGSLRKTAESTEGINSKVGTKVEEAEELESAAAVKAAKRAAAVQKTIAAREAMLSRGRVRAASLHIAGVKSLVDHHQDGGAADAGAVDVTAAASSSASSIDSSAASETTDSDKKMLSLSGPEDASNAPWMSSPHPQDTEDSFGSCEGSSESDQEFGDEDNEFPDSEGVQGGAPADSIDDASADGSSDEGLSKGSLEPIQDSTPSASGVGEEIDKEEAIVVLERLLPLTSDMVMQRRAMLHAAQQADNDEQGEDGEKAVDENGIKESVEGHREGVFNSSTVSPSTQKARRSNSGLAQGLRLAVARADMKAFRRARPRASLETFRGWYSSSSSNNNEGSNQLWALPPPEREAFWDECVFLPEGGGNGSLKPLFAVASEAEKALHYFETATASHVLVQLLLALVPATHFALAAALLDLRNAAPPLAQSSQEAHTMTQMALNAVALEASVAKVDLLAQRAVAALTTADSSHDNDNRDATNAAHSESSVPSEEYSDQPHSCAVNAPRSHPVATALAAVDTYAIELAKVEKRMSRALALGHRMSGGLGRCAEANLIDGQPAHLNLSYSGSSGNEHALSVASKSGYTTTRATVFNFLDEQYRNAQGEDSSRSPAASGPHVDDKPQTTNASSLDRGSSAPYARGVSSSSSTQLDGSSIATNSSGGVLCPPTEREYVFWRRSGTSILEHGTSFSGSNSSGANAADDADTVMVRLACAVHEADTFPATRSVRLAFSAPQHSGI